MEKTNYYIRTNEFQVVKYKKSRRGEMGLGFEFPEQGGRSTLVIMDLSGKDWGNLLGFLHATEDEKLLPKEMDAYTGFTIDKNQIAYFQIKDDKMLTKIILKSETDQRYMKRVMDSHLKEYPGIKRAHLTKDIYLEHGANRISMPRRKFLRFRKFVIKAHHHLFVGDRREEER